MINLLILLFAVFLGWILYLTYILYCKTKDLRFQSSIVLFKTVRKSGSLSKVLRVTNKALWGFLIYRQARKAVEIFNGVSFLAGFLFNKIKL